MTKLLPAVIKTAVTVTLMFLLFRKVDFHQFSMTLAQARIGLLVLSFTVLWIAHYVCIFRWRMLMRPLMPVLSRGRLFGIYCIGLFFNLALPTVVGGDVVKMYYAGKPSRQYARSFAATFLDRDAGMLAMMLIACAAVTLLPAAIPGIPASLVVWAAFVTFLFTNVAIFTPSLHKVVTSFLHRFKMSRLAAKIDAISSAFQVMGREWHILAASLAISFINQFLVILVTWIMSEGLRLHVPFLYFLVFVPIITLISMIPVSLNGMGLREYAFMSLFSAIGVSSESCIALGLLSSAAIILSAIPGGIVYLFFKNRSDAQEIATLEAKFS
jgi:glycosyltransferase 2 family protein